MAKDKSKKKDKGTFSDEFGKPSEAPATGGDSWRLEVPENVGKLFLITPLRIKDDAVGFENQTAEVIVADVVEINEKNPAKSVEHAEVWLWGGWVKGAVRGYVGTQRVPCRLEQDSAKGRGKNAAWVLEDPSKKDIDKVREYLASVDPFAQKGASAKADKAEPAKKSKAKADDVKPAKKKGKKK